MTFRRKLLKLFYPVIMNGSKSTEKGVELIAPLGSEPKEDFYLLKMGIIGGGEIDFSNLRGKKVIIVNTASDCGYTDQYKELQELYQKGNKKLAIIGFPANDFKDQEKGSDAEIEHFCQLNYGVEFPLAKKSQVIKGDNQNEVFKWLSNKSKNGWNSQDPVWNFSKYLISEEGKLLGFYGPAIKPSELPISLS